MRFLIPALFLSATAATAQTVDPDRRALFVKLVEDNGCKMTNAQAGQILPANGFDRSEMMEIVFQLEDEKLAEVDGAAGVITLKTENCG